MSAKSRLLWLLSICLSTAIGRAAVERVSLQNATATFSQTQFATFPPGSAINGSDADNRGWSIYPNIISQTFVVETSQDTGVDRATILTFQLNFTHFSAPPSTAHPLGRFRLAATADPRSDFADGLATGGDVTANWVILNPITFASSAGATLTELGDHSILASGILSDKDIYTITVANPLNGITGFRLEALEDPTLPHNGPGREPLNGNFCLSEFIVFADTDLRRIGPLITAQPISQQVLGGTDVTFNVSAQTLGTLSYQWFFNGSLLSGQTGSSLFLPRVSPQQQGSYTVSISDQNGVVTSMPAILTVVDPPPGIPVQLQNATATFSQTQFAEFPASKTINGDDSDNRGWSIYPQLTDQSMVVETISDLGVAGATLLTVQLHMSHVSPSAAVSHALGRFRLSATTDPRNQFADGLQSGGDVTANWVILDPIASTSLAGVTLTELPDHSILASGLLVEKDIYTISIESPLTGITGLRLEALEHFSLPHNGPGREPLNGNFCLSEVVLFANTDPNRAFPRILVHPQSREVIAGGTVAFSVSVESLGNPQYQWFRNGIPLPLANSSTLIIAALTVQDEGTYHAVVTDEMGSRTSDGAVLRISGSAGAGEIRFRNFASGLLDAPVTDAYGVRLAGPAFLAQLYAGASASTLAPVGPPAPFGTGARAGYFDDATRLIPGTFPGQQQFIAVRVWEVSAGPSYELALANGGAHGTSDVLQVTLGGGANPPAELTGLRPFTLAGKPRITQGPAGVTLDEGATVFLTVNAEGTSPLQFQWLKDGLTLPNASLASLVLSNATPALSGLYTVIVSNQFGAVTSAPAAVFIRRVDREPPLVTITSPSNGSIISESVTLAGTVNDNVGVTRAEWGRNGLVIGPLLLSNGAFSIQPALPIGSHNLFVRAYDAEGNSSRADVSITLQVSREFSLELPASAREGSRVTIPLVYRGLRDISGATLNVAYPEQLLADPELIRVSNQGGMLLTSNTNTPGLVRGTFALAGATLTEGPFALLSFRVKSLPSPASASLVLYIQNLFGVNGQPIVGGTNALGGSLPLTVRRIEGDNNANDTLDVADASIMLRMITGLDPVRSWDISGNDLNNNTELDAGDVIRVLRAVVQLDPQPSPGTQTSLLSRQSVSAAPALLVLTSDTARVKAGDKVKVRIKTAATTDLSGVSFLVQFPADALRLEDDPSSIRIADSLPDSALSLWNLDSQRGSLHFAASSASPWSSAGDDLLELTFAVTASGLTPPSLAIKLRDVVFADGSALREGEDVQFALEIAQPTGPTILGAARLANGSFHLRATVEPGTRHLVETSSNLKIWTPLATVSALEGNLSFTDETAATEPHRFYRLRLTD